MMYDRCAVLSFAEIEGDPAPDHDVRSDVFTSLSAGGGWFTCVMPNDREPPTTMAPFSRM